MAKKIEVCVLISVFILVFGCFSVPIIVYVTSSEDTASKEVALIEMLVKQFDIDECSQKPIENSTVVYGKNCSQYEGICSAHLRHLQVTASNNNLTVITHNAIKEQQLSKFFHFLEDMSYLINEECLAAVTPFLCQYVYPPCDSNGGAKLITQEECSYIRDETCSLEWKFAMATELRSYLPICEEENITETVKCHHQFKEYCGVCLPLCGKFSQYTDQVRISEDIVIICSSILGAIGALIMFTVAGIRRKEMLEFPQVLAVYSTAYVLILGQEELLCSHEALHLVVLNLTAFAEAEGFVIHFALLCITLTWFLHLFHLFLVLSFPFWSKFLSEQKWKIRLHIAEVLGCIVVSSIAPIVCLSTSQYTIARFPPLFIRPSRDISFYSIVLPNTILLAVGVNLTVYSFSTIRKNGLHKREKTCLALFSVPEVKILTLLSYSVVFGIVQLLNFTISINNATPFLKDLFKYFECQLPGYDPVCEDIRRQFETYLKPEVNGVSYFLFALITWVNLLFAVRGDDIKWLIQKVASYYQIVKARFHKTGSSSKTASATNTIAKI